MFAGLVTSVCLLLGVGCGGGGKVSGIYEGVPGNSVFDRIEFKSGGDVTVTLIGIDYQAKYSVSGSTVSIDNQGQTSALTIDDDGCLVDGIGGRYCKGAQTAGSKPSKGGGLSGAYVANGEQGRTMTLSFTNATQFNMVLSGDGMDNSLPGTYEVRGDQVSLKILGDTEGQAFTLKGRTLIGSLEGEAMVFTKK